MKTLQHRRQRGFSLVELGIVLVVLGLIAVAFVAYWRSATVQKSQLAERALLEVVERAVVGFAQSHARLPCPAADGEGSESCASGQVGLVPWRTLGVADNGAREIRYGVYRAAAPSTAPWLDMDLALNIDRLPPLFTVGLPPVLPQTPQLAGMLGSANLLDFCYAVNSGSTAVASATALAVNQSPGGDRRAVAFVLATPGLVDADGDGNRFDGAQANASAALPTFDASNRPSANDYDDQVVAVSFDALFAQLGCGQAMSAISHSHVAAATSAAFVQQGMVNYLRQMEINKMIADGGVAQAAAGIAGAAAGLSDAIANVAISTALTILSYGSTAAILAPAVASIAFNTLAVASAAGTTAQAVAVQTEAATRVTRAQELVGATATLATSIKTNAVAADSRGF